MDSDGFFLNPDLVINVWFGIRTSNGRKWRKSIPLADNKHCYVVVVVYQWVSENDISAILTGFWWYKF